MPDQLADILRDYKAAATEVAKLKERLPKAQQRVRDLRPQLAAAIADDIRTGRRTQIEISRLTGYTPERIRQICNTTDKTSTSANVGAN
jgi:hypothetical protein